GETPRSRTRSVSRTVPASLTSSSARRIRVDRLCEIARGTASAGGSMPLLQWNELLIVNEHLGPVLIRFLHVSLTTADDRGMVQIAFLGAGSVVFTRQLVADLLRFPELAGAHLALHDIDAD